MAFARIGGKSYLFTANEGDTKEEYRRVTDIGYAKLDATAFSDAGIVADGKLGRLGVDNLFGLKAGYNLSVPWDAQTGFDKLIMPGARSFSIIDLEERKLVWDSGDQFDRILSEHRDSRAIFHTDNDENKPDTRSDAKGSEPESVAVFPMQGRWYASIALERQSGMMLYDVSNPAAPRFLAYNSNGRPLNATLSGEDAIKAAGGMLLGPEHQMFVAAEHSPNGKPLLMAGGEVSNDFVIFEVGACWEVDAAAVAAEPKKSVTLRAEAVGYSAAEFTGAMVDKAKMAIAKRFPAHAAVTKNDILLTIKDKGTSGRRTLLAGAVTMDVVVNNVATSRLGEPSFFRSTATQLRSCTLHSASAC